VTPLYPQKLALTSPTGGGRSVGIVRVRTKATEFSLVSSSSSGGGGKVHPRTSDKGLEGLYRYGCTVFVTTALDGVGGPHHASAALPPEMTRYPLYRMLGGLQGRSGREEKISPSQGFDTRTVQPVASRYADCAIPAYRIISIKIKLKTLLRLRAELYLLPQLTMSNTKLKACCVGPLRKNWSSSSLSGARYIAGMEDMRNPYQFSFSKTEGKKPLERPWRRQERLLKWILNK